MQIDERVAWDDLRVLLALHRHGSFLNAGRSLGVSTSTVARRIEALEGSLGRSLVHRSNTGTRLEPEAVELVALAEQLELGLRAARRSKGEGDDAGPVRISCGEGFVRPITRALAELRRLHPGLSFELSPDSRAVDLARREADIGVRKVRSASPSLIERKLGELSFALYAAPSYLERRLRSNRLPAADFARHDFIGYEGPLAATPHMRWLSQQGAARFSFRTTSDVAYQHATEEGLGIGLLAEALGGSLPGLQRLSTETAPPGLPVYLVYHRDLRRVPRIRLVLDALDAAFHRAVG